MSGNNPRFVVRHLQSTSLDGAFRVHLPPECLDQLGLKVGDLCEITSEEGTTSGCGIAWRAADKMGSNPKTRPVKMTGTLKDAFEIKDGSHVTISTTKATTMHADHITLTDVTPAEYMQGQEHETDDGRWWSRCFYLLCNSEAIASGTTFDASAKKGIRKRFCIEHVESSAAQAGLPSLYECDDKTQVVFSDPARPLPSPTVNGDRDITTLLSADEIGGLTDQLQALNKRMERVLKGSRDSRHVLVNGYEGTGKSFLLRNMARAGFRKVVRIDQSTTRAGTVAKNEAAIESMFSEARARQPSLVIVDDLEKLAPADESLYSRVLCAELDKVIGSNVLVVGACRSPNQVSARLLEPDRLIVNIELPIPDVQARSEILRVLLRRKSKNLDIREIGLRTHGFTGRDLVLLVQLAQDRAGERLSQQQVETSHSPAQNGALETLPEDAVHSQAVARIEKEQPEQGDAPRTGLSMEDFEVALTKVRPTALRELFFETPKIQWSDIGGSQALKEQFDEIIGWPLYHADMMEEDGIRPTKGVLLYGPPGCSKTLTAQAVATTYKLNFIAVKGAELTSMYVGESERSIREIFRKARAAAPCVIFFDEIDAIASDREGSGTKGLNVVTTLLNEMDGFDALKKVLVLAATNKPQALDPAIMRPGRFDEHFYLGLPNAAARKEIFEITTKGLGADIDFAKLPTDGYTGAEVVTICQRAMRERMRRRMKLRVSDEPLGADDMISAIQQTKKAITRDMLAEFEAFGETAAADQ